MVKELGEQEQDLIGISSYPRFVTSNYSPDAIPPDYFEEIARHSGIPVFVTETGWCSGSDVVPASSEEKQRDYIARFPELLENVEAEALMYIALRDLLPDLKIDVPHFKTLGLRDHENRSKPAWFACKRIKELPRTP